MIVISQKEGQREKENSNITHKYLNTHPLFMVEYQKSAR